MKTFSEISKNASTLIRRVLTNGTKSDVRRIATPHLNPAMETFIAEKHGQPPKFVLVSTLNEMSIEIVLEAKGATELRSALLNFLENLNRKSDNV